MESIRKLFNIGMGPSSSHTIGPNRAAKIFKKNSPTAHRFVAHLYGSLALTGKGHLTDKAIKLAFEPLKVKIVWHKNKFLKFHPNAMQFEALDKNGKLIRHNTFYSVGGGKIIHEKNNKKIEIESIYKYTTVKKILRHLNKHDKTFWQFVEDSEGEEIWIFLKQVWKIMKQNIKDGIHKEGYLPGGLKLARKAKTYYKKNFKHKAIKYNSNLFAYALSCPEESASGSIVVAAPTCGSCGVIPGVLYYMKEQNKYSDDEILKALATASVFGNLAKTNASISGAEVGCQGEIGVACAMAAAAACYLEGGNIYQIEYAAEIGLEHHLGLTCDPIGGLVQIPCIERNAMGASRALEAAAYALISDGHQKVSYDDILETMEITGHDLSKEYRETALGGLAKYMKNRINKEEN